MRKQERIQMFVGAIWQWYAEHKRTLPWRDLDINDDAERAYRILVSEIMLQQTQVPRVKITYRNFLEQFPTISDLAVASNKDVILAWRGMGYNNRALRLRDAAREVDSGKCIEDNERFPREMNTLQKLPGVGHYTAAAIRNFAFNIPTPCIDTNIRRILHRTFIGPEHPDGTWKKDDKYVLNIASQLLEEAEKQFSTFHFPLSTHKPKACADWHAALMDFGSLVQTKRNPKWDICPLSALGIMKATASTVRTPHSSVAKKKEPGRMVGGKFIPNRIFRGKVIEELRDEHDGLSIQEIGKRICIDWSTAEHSTWLEGIIASLKKDQLLTHVDKDILVLKG